MGRSINLAIILCIILGPFLALASDNYYVRVYPTDYKASLEAFSTVFHYDIAGVNRERGTIDVIVSRDAYKKLISEFQVEVLRGPDQEGQRVDPQYKTPDEIEQLMLQFHNDFPGITHLESIGQSEQGRDIWALKISDNPEWTEDEPVLLFNAQHHAREVMTSEVILDMIEYLCSEYGTNFQVTEWVNTREIWAIPQVNVDGSNYVFSNYDMWRKDRHSPPSGSSYYGIDPNRNYPADWGSCGGSSGYAGDDDYRGQYAGESYCVSNMMDFESTIMPLLDISFHSYSELVIYSYGCDGDYSPDHEALSTTGQEMAGLIQRDSGGMGYSPGTSWELLYATDGGDIDWLYQDLGTFAYVIEVNGDSQGFLPSYNQWRDSTVTRLRPAWQYMLNRVDGPGITGIVTDACDGSLLNAEVNITEVPLSAKEAPRMTNNFGRYCRFLKPGDYHLQVSADGYNNAVIPFHAGIEMVDLDVALVPVGSNGLYLSDYQILDSTGDDDGVMDPGETVSIQVSLLSAGFNSNISGHLQTSDPFVSIITADAGFGNIPDGMMGMSQSPHFEVEVSSSCPESHEVMFQLNLTADQTLCVDEGYLVETVSTMVYQCPIFEELMDSNPGYTIQNQGSGGWAYGDPSSGPQTGHTGSNCYATNLSGDYGNNGNYSLISTPFDCSLISGAQLRFWRWLQNESGYDSAYVEISTDGSSWQILWSGYAWDTDWTEQVMDISDVADGQPEVYIRWRQYTDTYVQELGFYLDDVSICGMTFSGVPPTNTPIPPTATWTPTATPTSGVTSTPTPTILPTNTPIPTFTPVPTFTPPPTYTPPPTGTVPPTATPTEPPPTVTPETPTVTPAPPTETPPNTPTKTPLPSDTPTPQNTAIATETPTPVTGFHGSIRMNDHEFTAGEMFELAVEVANGGEETAAVDEYLLLSVAGYYFFYPQWGEDVGFVERDVPPGYHDVEPVLAFEWPEEAGAADDLSFYLGFFNRGTWDQACDVDAATFSFR